MCNQLSGIAKTGSCANTTCNNDGARMNFDIIVEANIVFGLGMNVQLSVTCMRAREIVRNVRVDSLVD